MQDQNEIELSFESPLRVPGKGLQGLIHSRKQEVEHDSLVAEDDRVQLVGQSEDQMEVSAGQELCLSIIEPLFLDQCLTFRAVPVPTGVIGDTLETTLIALFNMTAEGCCPAKLDMAHCFALSRRCFVICTVGFTIQAKDISDLKSGVFCTHASPSMFSNR